MNLIAENASEKCLNSLIDALPDSLRDRFDFSSAIREQHGHGEDHFEPIPPDAVFYPRATDDVKALVSACHRLEIPVIPYGAGTSVEGQLIALKGGVSIDLSLMNEIIEISPQDMTCRVQAGVTREALNHALRHQGLFFPVDPGANASIGGMAATRASGTNAVRYGTMRDNVMGLTVVTAQGTEIRTGGRSVKSSAGYDLTRLFVGSEGTLGVMTEIQLKLSPIPDTIKAAVCAFTTLEDAVNSVMMAVQCGIDMARIELLNQSQMDACISYSQLEGFESKPTLFLEFHGSDTSVAEQIDAFMAITEDFGGSKFRWAETTEDRNELWKARHHAYFAAQAAYPNQKALTTDVCVPISRLAENILAAENRSESLGLASPVCGHVGDGNYHMIIFYDAADPDQADRAKQLAKFIVSTALASDGTCTGEHGIGYGKKQYLIEERGEAVEYMKTIKRALDPGNIMNPGKIFDL